MRGVVPTFLSPYDMAPKVNTVLNELISSWRPPKETWYDPLHHDIGQGYYFTSQWKRDRGGAITRWCDWLETFFGETTISKDQWAKSAILFTNYRQLYPVLMNVLEKAHPSLSVPWDNFVKFMAKFDSKWYLIAIVDLFDENPAERFQDSESTILYNGH